MISGGSARLDGEEYVIQVDFTEDIVIRSGDRLNIRFPQSVTLPADQEPAKDWRAYLNRCIVTKRAGQIFLENEKGEA